jgi:CelD/BcsL family acetyltransferase involved in cellulose biosynthesis
MDVVTLTDAAAFHGLRDEWLRLLAQMPFQSVFLTPQWQDVWWRHFAGNRQLCLFAVRSDDGVLRGLAPLMLDREAEGLSRLSFVGDLDVCDYCDVLVDPAYVSQVGAALVPAMLDAVGDEGDLELINLSSHSLTPGLLHQGLEAHGLTVEIEAVETCPTIDLPTEWEAYLATLRSKDRHELRRKLRRAQTSARLHCRVTREADALVEDLEIFFSLHRMSQQADKREFMTAGKVAFFQDLARTLGACGWFELTLLYANDVAIAALCGFPYGSTYAAYNAGFHPNYSYLSAGTVLFADRIRDAIDRRFTHFDFLRGDERYKYRFGASDQPLSQLLVRTACSVSGWYS